MNTSVFRFFVLTAGVFVLSAPAHAGVQINPFPQGGPVQPLVPQASQQAPAEEPSPVVTTGIISEDDASQAAALPVDLQAVDVQPVPQPGAETPITEQDPTAQESSAQEPASGGDESGKLRIFWTDKPLSQKWQAAEGQNIRDILENWSEAAGVRLIWQSRNQYAVLQSIDQNTTYENAVRALLEQYQKSEVRPVGALHIDPASGEQVLVVEDGA